MVEQRSQMVNWLRKMVRRGSIDETEHTSPDQDQSETSTQSISPQSSRDGQTKSPPSLRVDRAGTPNVRQRLNVQDSASVMTIASSSKRRRQSIDTNASTRAMAAESVFSWDAHNEETKTQAS